MLTTGPIQAFHAENPLRVWSLIVTVFGDIVMQQGTRQPPSPIWSGAIIALLELLGIDAGLVRTSLSRLVANGILIRIKLGRNTYYELAAPSQKAFSSAANVIYGRTARDPKSQLLMVSIDRCSNRAKTRELLMTKGVRFIGPTVGLVADDPEKAFLHWPDGCLLSIPQATPELFLAAQDAWNLTELNQSYRRFLDVFSSAESDTLVDTAAVTTRILLVHQFRRLKLRDPELAEEALPKSWLGNEARQHFETQLAAYHKKSEQWIASTGFLTGKAKSL
jgi:phenylacetic acid degradation operon negative regulatory protein